MICAKAVFLASHCNPIYPYLWKHHESWNALKLPFWPGVRGICEPNRLFHLRRSFHQDSTRTKEWSIEKYFFRWCGRLKQRNETNTLRNREGRTPDFEEGALWMWRENGIQSWSGKEPILPAGWRSQGRLPGEGVAKRASVNSGVVWFQDPEGDNLLPNPDFTMWQ